MKTQKSAPQKVAKVKPVAKAATDTASILFDRVASILDEARGNVVRAVNTQMVLAYWLIGREIVQELQGGADRAISRKLVNARYGNVFSTANLNDFCLFYTVYQSREQRIRSKLKVELQPTSAAEAKVYDADLPFHPRLTWSHYRALMRVDKPNARQFYEEEAVLCGWKVRELERQIHSFYYERLLMSKDKRGMLQDQRREKQPTNVSEILKSPTVLEFLNLPDSPKLHETKLEQAIIDNLQSFLLELGKGFSFVARQKCLRYDDDVFYVDLVFYNYLLKCFVLIDLKIGKLTHQDVGQLDSYVRMYEDLFKVEGDNPTIGLILCSDKSGAVAKYSVLNESKQLFASSYTLYLPTEEELSRELERERNAAEDRILGKDRE